MERSRQVCERRRQKHAQGTLTKKFLDDPVIPVLTRRQFLKTGLIGGAVLFTAYWTWRWTMPKGLSTPYLFLTEKEAVILAQLSPVLLGDTLMSAVPKGLLLKEIDVVLSSLTQSTQQEMKKLFALLEFAPFRFGVMGISSWEEAQQNQLSSVLSKWRTSHVRLFRTMYLALQQITFAAYYSMPVTWEKIGYPGPLRLTA